MSWLDMLPAAIPSRLKERTSLPERVAVALQRMGFLEPPPTMRMRERGLVVRRSRAAA